MKVLLKGEGETQVVIRRRVRVECEECGEPATKKHTFVLPKARNNHASSAYGKDDITWCSDHAVFSCDTCHGGREPRVEGYEWCGTFSIGERFAHMFLHWKDEPADALLIPQQLYDSEINFTVSAFWDGGFNVGLGDNMNGFKAESDAQTFFEAMKQLRDLADKHFPESDFAHRQRAQAA